MQEIKIKILHIDYEAVDQTIFRVVAGLYGHQVMNKDLIDPLLDLVKLVDGQDVVVLNRETFQFGGDRRNSKIGEYLSQLAASGYQGKVAVTTTMDDAIVRPEKEAHPKVMWFHKPSNYLNLLNQLERQ